MFPGEGEGEGGDQNGNVDLRAIAAGKNLQGEFTQLKFLVPSSGLRFYVNFSVQIIFFGL